MKRLAILAALVATNCWSAQCDLNAPLPTSAEGLRHEKSALLQRLAVIDSRLSVAAPQTDRSNRLVSPPVAPRSTAAPAVQSLPSGCHVGPRGGTYTITKSGRKNYGGC